MIRAAERANPLALHDACTAVGFVEFAAGGGWAVTAARCQVCFVA
ncbi:MAG TPA: hypothetical protein VLT84_12460 [Acidobacteriota bacterium]|nr:hypothetical protein [Acidobacteriota bacterium]